MSHIEGAIAVSVGTFIIILSIVVLIVLINKLSKIINSISLNTFKDDQAVIKAVRLPLPIELRNSRSIR